MLFDGRGDGGAGIFIRLDEAKICFQIVGDDGKSYRIEECPDLSLDSWHYIACTAQAGHRMTIYLDGLPFYYLDLPKTLPKLTGGIIIGASADGGESFIGDLDEIRISNISRQADWLRAGFKNQGPDAGLVTMGTEEMGGGGGLPVFYLATVLKNITLDGWVVIGCLGLLGIMSWLVFLGKASSLWVTDKENKRFKSSFLETPDPLAYARNGNKYDNSSLYRVFWTGFETLQRCLQKNGYSEEDTTDAWDSKTGVLDSRAINAIKASLERGYIEESQRLNAWLVILTMAITGGPFLGLLGTVWGVMNTFAAMAEAGEANIMAIAPGVASALSTTVIGLIVAIPALFGYNYLIGKIKSISAEMMIIVDQVSINTEEIYGVSK